jgi:predicted phosphohydrolase
MRLLVTADLHYNHARSREGADALIDEINAVNDIDALLVVGDVGVADGDSIEACLSRFTFAGPRLFVPGNHELWSKRPDVNLLDDELPRRVRSLDWHWLPDEPFVNGTVGVVGSIGWYDYAFAEPSLEIPHAFYEAKVSPGAVLHTNVPAHLVDAAHACPAVARDVIARWNDGKFVALGMSDDALVRRECGRLADQLELLRGLSGVVVATHTVPFAELLPDRHTGQWDFARAYLGSPRLGQTIQRFGNVSHVVCGHSHFPREADLGPIHAVNVGAGYRVKRHVTLEV